MPSCTMNDSNSSYSTFDLEHVVHTIVHHLSRISSSSLSPQVVAALSQAYQHLESEYTVLDGDASIPAPTPTAPEDPYHALLGFMSNAYLVTDSKLRIQEVNNAACRMMRSSEAALLGTSLDQYFNEVEANLLRAKARQVAASPSQTQEYEATLQLRPGIRVAVAVKAGAMRNGQETVTGIRWLLHDISRRKQTSARLQRTYKLLLALVEASPLGIVMVDNQGRVQLWSKAAEQILGWMQEEVLGQVPKHVPPEVLQKGLLSASYLEDLPSGSMTPQEEYEVAFRRKDGTPISVRTATAALYDPNGQVIGWLEIFIDITKQQKLRGELQQTKAKLASSREAEQRRLARGLHDDVIQQLIALQMELAAQRRRAQQNTLDMDDLPAMFARLEGGVVATVKELRNVLRELRPAGLEEYGLISALDGYVNQLSRQYTERQLQIEKKWSKSALDIPISVANCLFRVAQEALRNIIRHTSAHHVEILIYQTASHTMMEIRDDGEGFVVPANLAHLAQAGHLGLVGMQERVELVGGEMQIQSTPGQGAVIIVRIPLKTEERVHE